MFNLILILTCRVIQGNHIPFKATRTSKLQHYKRQPFPVHREKIISIFRIMWNDWGSSENIFIVAKRVF